MNVLLLKVEASLLTRNHSSVFMQVIAQYYAIAGEHHKSEEDILAIFNKKVNNNPKFKVLKDKVKLLK